jgi:RNA polymerase sigma factor (sigma-70 family)
MNADEDNAIRCLAGCQTALHHLVDSLSPSVFGLCFRLLGHRQDAEDVTQEVLVRVFRSLSRWDRTRPLRPWVLMIAVNRCKTHRQKNRLVPDPIDLWEQTLSENAEVPATELTRAIAEFLNAMREEYRVVFELFHEQGMTYDQISEIVGRPVGTIKTWLHRARIELFNQLSQAGFVDAKDYSHSLTL